MDIKKIKQTEIIPSLLDITYTIVKVYEKLQEYYLENNKKQYQQYLENLALCQQIENRLYHQLITNKDYYHDLISQISWQNQVRVEENSIKKLVLSRIVNYLTTFDQVNPFRSNSSTEIVAYIENFNIIQVQFIRDYIPLLVYLLEQKINKVSDLELKKLLISERFDIILSSKLLENTLLVQTEKPLLEGRKRAILFNHDPKLVTEVFLDESKYNISCAFDTLSFLDLDNNIDQSFDLYDQCEYIIELTDLETILTMLEIEELKNFYSSFLLNKVWKNMAKKGNKEPSKTLMDCKEVFQKVLTAKEKTKVLKP